MNRNWLPRVLTCQPHLKTFFIIGGWSHAADEWCNPSMDIRIYSLLSVQCMLSHWWEFRQLCCWSATSKSTVIFYSCFLCIYSCFFMFFFLGAGKLLTTISLLVWFPCLPHEVLSLRFLFKYWAWVKLCWLEL